MTLGTKSAHCHTPDLCVGPSSALAVCRECAEPLLLDDAGFRPLTGLEFEDLPNEAIQKFAALAAEARSSGCDHLPAYVRVMAELRGAAERWMDEHPPGSCRLLRFLLPPEHVYIAAMLSDVLDRASNGCPYTREFLAYLDKETQQQATLTQLRMFIAEVGSKVDPSRASVPE